MFKYKNSKCPCCENSFKESDDVVVCPDCGTPHHRSCYFEKNECKNLLLHGSGFLWKSPIENAISGQRASEEQEALGKTRWESFKETHGKNLDEESLKSFQKFFERTDDRLENMKNMKERFETRDIFGVSEHEIVAFQSTNNPFLVERYRKIAQSGSFISFNIFAGFLCPYYAFYFRTHIIAVLLAVVNFLLYIPRTLSTLYNLNIITGDKNYNTILEMNNSYLFILNFGMIILVALFFDYFYLKWMSSKIKEVRARFQTSENKELSNEYYLELASIGRPSLLKGLIDYIVTSGVMHVFLFIALYLLNII